MLKKYKSIVFTITLGLLAQIILCFLLSSTPFLTLKALFFGPFKSTYSIGNMLCLCTVFIIAALGVSIGIKGGCFNLGGEGQMYAGGLVATIIAIKLENLGFLGLLFALLASMFVSAILAGLSGYLKQKFKTNELITSYLISSITVLVVNYLITGPFMAKKSNLLATDKIPSSMYFSSILPPSNLSTSFIVAIIIAVLTHLFLKHTKVGLSLKTVGLSYRFSVYSGIYAKGYYILSMVLSGALIGLSGALYIMGDLHLCAKDFCSGMGFNSLTVALIAQTNPLGIIPVSILFSWIESGAKIATQSTQISSNIASIIQAVMFFFITCEALGGKNATNNN